MSNLPPVIIFVNSDPITITPDGYFVDGYAVNPDGYINDLTLNTFKTQLFITDSMTLAEFNARVAAFPNYPDVVHSYGYRILVINPNFQDFTNRNLADVVLFYNQGMVTIEFNKFGPPCQSIALQRLNIYDLLRDVGSSFVVILPNTSPPPPHHHHHLGGIVAIEGADQSGVYCPNPDNEYNNPDFINRK